MMCPNRIPGSRVLLFFLLFVAGWVNAAQIRVESDRNPVSLDETFRLIFTVEGEAAGEPDFSVLEKELQVLGSSRSLRSTFINGKLNRTNQYLVTVMAKRAGELVVPAVNFGSDRSPVIKIMVKEPPAGADSAGEEQKIFIETELDTATPYVQQQVILTVRIYHRLQWREASLADPVFRGGEVLVQKLGEDRNYQRNRKGENWQVIERRYALFPQQSGELMMDPLVLTMKLPGAGQQRRSPFGGFDDFFGRGNWVRKVVRSQSLLLKVKPVADAFKGGRWLAAKALRLEESWSVPPDQLRTGEPVTRTVALIADGVTVGQLPEIGMQEMAGVQVYPDKPVTNEQHTDSGVLASSSRKFALIPARPGSYRLPAIEVRWWDVDADREAVAKLPEQVLTVIGAAPPAQAPPPPVASGAPKPSAPSRSDTTVASSGESLNRWLLAATLLFLSLWLITLAAWYRARGQKPAAAVRQASVAQMQKTPDTVLWRQLEKACELNDADRVRHLLLQLADLLWPEQPPRSLEAMARLVPQSLAEGLLQLSRHLYAGGRASWEPQQILAGMDLLKGDLAPAEKAEAVLPLKPLYPKPAGR